jgi:hypothetical protein
MPLSMAFLQSIKTVISGKDDHAWFAWLYGNWCNPDRRWDEEACVHGYRNTLSLSEPSLDTTATDVGMTGWHPRWVVWDDPLVANKIRAQGTHIENALTAFNATYKALANDGILFLVCTRYQDNDVAGSRFTDEGILSWDGMECPNTMIFSKHAMGTGKWRVFHWDVEEELTGRATCPEIMDEERMAHEKAINAEDYACQYRNNPGSGEHAPITEQQIRDCFMDYEDLRHTPIMHQSVHLDTAFKNLRTIRSGDYSVIVPFFHDQRPNGIVYLHTDQIRASNMWRSEQFTDALIDVLRDGRRQFISLHSITDEREMGGKEGMYKQYLLSTLRGAGFKQVNDKTIKQFPRQGTIKRERIRKAAALWAQGYVRVLLHKDQKGNWIVPELTRVLLNQFMRVDTVGNDDLADAASDVFMPGVWRKPTFDTNQFALDEGARIRQPGDEELKSIGEPLTNEQLRELMEDSTEYNNGLGPGALPSEYTALSGGAEYNPLGRHSYQDE